MEQGARHPRFMTTRSRQIMAQRMSSLPMLAGFDRSRWSAVVDWLAVGVAVSLPWSTTATDVLVVVWLVAVLPILELPALRRELSTAAAYLPVLLWLLAAIGMLWADVSWAERFSGRTGSTDYCSFRCCCCIFKSRNAASGCCGAFLPRHPLCCWRPGLRCSFLRSASRENVVGVPVKEYISQSAEFVVCAFVLLGWACEAARHRRWRLALGLVVTALLFLADILFVVTSRAALLVVVVLLLFLAWKEFRWRGLVGAFALGCVAATAIWSASPYLRDRLTTSVTELKAYREKNAANSTGLHLEFLRKSLTFVSTAPLFGHGTGSIPQQFRQAAVGDARRFVGDLGNTSRSDFGRCRPDRPDRRRRARRHVDRAFSAVHRQRARVVDRSDCRAPRMSSHRSSTFICSPSSRAGFTSLASASSAGWYCVSAISPRPKPQGRPRCREPAASRRR